VSPIEIRGGSGLRYPLCSSGSTILSGILGPGLGNSPLPKRRIPGPALERVRIPVAVWPPPTVKSNCFGFQFADAALSDSYLHCGSACVSVVVNCCKCGCVHACGCVDVIRHEAMHIGAEPSPNDQYLSTIEPSGSYAACDELERCFPEALAEDSQHML